MDFYLIPNDPQKTVLVSPNGVAHYQIRTLKARNGMVLSLIQRPADSEADSIVAEVEWKTWSSPTLVRSPLFRGLGNCVGQMGSGITARTFLYKRNPFSDSRYFVGDDGIEYRWAARKGIGCVLTSPDDDEIARYTSELPAEGLFAGEKKSFLRVHPCSIDLDLIVLSFMIMETKRRERAGVDSVSLVARDEDPQGDGGADGGEG